MKLKSVSGLGFYVQDLGKTADFYEKLGFRMGERSENHLRAYLNWFWLDFMVAGSEAKAEFQAEASVQPKGGGMYVNIAVEDVDEVYKAVVAEGWKPSSEPRDWPWGSREFVLRDPDGYKLAFFTKK